MISNNGHYAIAAGGGEGIPAPSPQDAERLLEAWREVLAEVLHTRDNEWKQQMRAVKAEAVAVIAEMRASAAEVRSTMEATIEKRLAQIREPADGSRGEQGERGERGLPGQLRAVRQFVEGGVHYNGDVVAHAGATYQALCDTARAPPHKDWACIATAGRDGCDGVDGQSLRVRGTYRAGEVYAALDIVAHGGGSFVARRDNPGECPGEGWQAQCLPGKKGDRGHPGERGPAGPAGPTIQSWQIDFERYQATPLMSDGSEGPPMDLRGLFEQFQMALFEQIQMEAR